MPNTKSAKKRLRQSEKRRLRNRSYKSRIKTLEKKYLATLATGDREVFSAIDKAVKAGVIHWATGDRKKSRLSSKLGQLAQATA